MASSFLPHLLSGRHWTLCRILPLLNRVEYFDPAGGKDRSVVHNCARMYNDCLSEAGRPVVAIWAYAFPAPDIHIPRQLDTYNCAMYMLMFAYRLVRAFAMFTTASSHTSPSTVGERAHLTRIVRHGLAEPHAVQGGCAGTQPPGRVTNVDIPRTTPPLASSQPSIASSTQLPSGFGRRVVSFPLNYLTGRPQKDKKTPCTRRHKGEVAWARTAARSSEVGRGAPAGPHWQACGLGQHYAQCHARYTRESGADV